MIRFWLTIENKQNMNFNHLLPYGPSPHYPFVEILLGRNQSREGAWSGWTPFNCTSKTKTRKTVTLIRGITKTHQKNK